MARQDLVNPPLTPDYQQAIAPCANCISNDPRAQWAVVLYLECAVMAQILQLPISCSADTLAGACPCYQCLKSDEELMTGLIQVLAWFAEQLGVSYDGVEANIACLLCEDEFTLRKLSLCLFGDLIYVLYQAKFLPAP